MPNKIAPDKAKVVYNELRETLDDLLLIAKRRRCSLSDVMREAARDYVEKHADTIELQKRLDAPPIQTTPSNSRPKKRSV